MLYLESSVLGAKLFVHLGYVGCGAIWRIKELRVCQNITAEVNQ